MSIANALQVKKNCIIKKNNINNNKKIKTPSATHLRVYLMSVLKRISMRAQLFPRFPALPTSFIDIFQPDVSSCFMHSALEFATYMEIPPLAAYF